MIQKNLHLYIAGSPAEQIGNSPGEEDRFIFTYPEYQDFNIIFVPAKENEGYESVKNPVTGQMDR